MKLSFVILYNNSKNVEVILETILFTTVSEYIWKQEQMLQKYFIRSTVKIIKHGQEKLKQN